LKAMIKCPLCKSEEYILKDYFYDFKKKLFKTIIYKLNLKKLIKLLSEKLYFKFTSGEEMFLDKKILICKNCNLGSVHPMIDDKILEDYYSKNYWENNRMTTDIVEKISEEEVKYFSEKIDFLKQNFNFQDKVIAEFGCGKGILANEVLKREKIKQYTAVEMSDKIILKELVKNRFMKTSKNLDLIEDKSIDLFIMIQSIEHISDINVFLKKLKSKLKDKAMVLIETPNYNKTYFQKKSGWTPHTLFFNKKSIGLLAKKFDCEMIYFKYLDVTWSEILEKKKKNEDEEGHNMRILLKF